jgi:hypothetical protein
MDEAALQRSRRELIQAGLIAYQKPLYQVLSLEPVPTSVRAAQRINHCVSIGEALSAVIGGAA